MTEPEAQLSNAILSLSPVRLLIYALQATTNRPEEACQYEAVSILTAAAAGSNSGEWAAVRDVLLQPLRDAATWMDSRPETRISLVPRAGADLEQQQAINIYRADFSELVALGMPQDAAHALATFPLTMEQLTPNDPASTQPDSVQPHDHPDAPAGTLTFRGDYLSALLRESFWI